MGALAEMGKVHEAPKQKGWRAREVPGYLAQGRKKDAGLSGRGVKERREAEGLGRSRLGMV